jgi:hypothetical protein
LIGLARVDHGNDDASRTTEDKNHRSYQSGNESSGMPILRPAKKRILLADKIRVRDEASIPQIGELRHLISRTDLVHIARCRI